MVTDDVVDSLELIVVLVAQHGIVNLHSLAIKNNLFVQQLVVSLEPVTITQLKYLHRHFVVGDEVHTFLQPTDRFILNADHRFVIVVLILQLIGEKPTRQLLDTVFQDVKKDKDKEDQAGIVAQIFLEGHGDQKIDHHGESGGEAERDLLDRLTVLGSIHF